MVRWTVELARRVLRRFDESLVGAYRVFEAERKTAQELRRLVLGWGMDAP